MPNKSTRLPVVMPLEPRSSTTNTDCKVVNGLLEQSQSGTLRVVKRPGNKVVYTGTSGTGQGITNYLNQLYSISGDFFSAFSVTTSLTAVQALNSSPWSPRADHASTNFQGRLWVLGGQLSPAASTPTFTATISGGVVTGVTANFNGLGYSPTYPTTITLSVSGGGGSGASVQATISNQSISNISVLSGGSGYTSPPNVTTPSTPWGVMNDVWSSVDGVNWTQITGIAPWGQRIGAKAIVFNSKMWIMGGTTSVQGAGTASDFGYTDVWSSSDGVNWTQTSTAAWPGRWNFGLTIFNNSMWVCGGFGQNNSNTNAGVYPTTAYSDCYYSPDGISWVTTTTSAPWIARGNFAFFATATTINVVGGIMIDAFSGATGDSWSSPDGTTWTLVSSNPFGVASSGVWPIAAISSPGAEISIPPAVSVNNAGTGGSGATAYCFADFDDESNNDEDAFTGNLMAVTFSAVGSGYVLAPTLSFNTAFGVELSAYAMLDGRTNGGQKGLHAVTVGNTTYILEYINNGTYVHVVWSTTDGITFTNLNVSFPSGWSPRDGAWLSSGNLWFYGGTTAYTTYFSDVWFISTGTTALALNPNVAAGYYHFTQTSTSISQPLLVFKSTKDLYSFNASLNSLTKLSNVANYPATTVPGIVYLDGYFFVMDPQGRIWNSSINDPTTWTALGVIAMQNEPNGGVAIAKLGNFVVGFGVWTTEYFYDNAVATPSSPLAPNQTFPIQVGCAAGESVIEMQGSVVWVGQTRKEGQGVYMMSSSYTPQRISTPFIDRILQNDPLTNVRAYTLDGYGHSLYVLTLITSGVTLVFDFTIQLWTVWTGMTPQATKVVTSLTCDPYGTVTAVIPNHGYSDGDPVNISGASVTGYNGQQNILYVDMNTVKYLVNSALAANPGTALSQGYTTGQFSPVAAAQVLDIDYVQDPTNGMIYSQDITDFTDHGNPVDLQVVTTEWDGDTTVTKFVPRLSVVGDKSASSLLLRYSDTNYQSWSSYRELTLNPGQRASTINCGRTRRRAFQLRHTDPTALRLETLEIEFILGDT